MGLQRRVVQGALQARYSERDGRYLLSRQAEAMGRYLAAVPLIE